MGYGSVTVPTGSAILVVAQNASREGLILTNEGASKVYLGKDASVTSATGISVEAEGGKYTEDSGGQRMYLGDIYAISADSTNDMRYWERTK